MLLSTMIAQSMDTTALIKDVEAIKKWHDHATEMRSGSFVTVGLGQLCDYTTIQDALGDGEPNIRLTSENTFFETLILEESSVNIRGGFITCEDAINNIQDNAPTVISAASSANQSVMTINVEKTPQFTVYLENIRLTTSNKNAGLSGAGLAILSDNVNVVLNQVIIDNNAAVESATDDGSGGGIAMLNNDITLDIMDSIIQNNSANLGGGIYCNGNGNTIRISGNSAVRSNTAQGLNANGGGIYSQLCKLTVYSGHRDLSLGIDSNTASANGGGIYLSASEGIFYGNELCSNGFCIGNNNEPVNLSRNQCINDANQQNGDGGALFAAGSTIQMNGVLVEGNSTQQGSGGALYIRGLPFFSVDRIQKECWHDLRCNAFINNTAGGDNSTGGAIQITSPTNVATNAFIRSTYFAGNSADGGSVIAANASSSENRLTLELTQSILEQNNGTRFDASTVRFSNNVDGLLIHNTVVDNAPAFSVINNQSTLNNIIIGASIILDNINADVVDSTTNISASCNIFHELDSVVGVNNQLLEGQLFSDSEYNLVDNAQAIDFCPDRLAIPDARDISYDFLGQENPDMNNFLGPYDAGAQEFVISDVIYANGFEEITASVQPQ